MPHPPAPFRRGFEQSVRHFLLIDGLEESEEADPVIMGLIVEPVADGGDSADDLAAPLGDKVFGLAMLEERGG